MIGIMGTNIARYSRVKRITSHKDQAKRTGAFYKLIGPSRLGKGIAMGLLSELGKDIQKARLKHSIVIWLQNHRWKERGRFLNRKSLRKQGLSGQLAYFFGRKRATVSSGVFQECWLWYYFSLGDKEWKGKIHHSRWIICASFVFL